MFDAYGTLLDVDLGGKAMPRRSGRQGRRISPPLWRTKQLEYSWLRSLMGRHADFWQVTGEALDYAMATLGVEDAGLRTRLMELYLVLEAYPDAKTALEALKRAGRQAAILSNGSPKMLASAVKSAGIGDLLDHVISVEECGIYKPHPSVYALAVKRLGLAAGAHLLRLVQRLGRGGRGGFRLQGGLGQPRRRQARAPARARPPPRSNRSPSCRRCWDSDARGQDPGPARRRRDRGRGGADRALMR